MNTYQILMPKIKKGFSYSGFTILYTSLIILGILMCLKLKFPNNTGLFFQDGNFVAFGMLNTTENAVEVLGDWFFPVTFLIVLIISLLIKIKINK